MDLNLVKNNLKKDFNCILINTINYVDIEIVKGLESTKNGVSYRYFKVLSDDNLEEIQDEALLTYLKRMNETNDKNIY